MKFMVSHDMPKGISKEDVIQKMRAGQSDPEIRGYRSFLNLTEGRGFCVFDAPDERRLVDWLNKNKMSYEDIMAVELEGEHGELVDVKEPEEALFGYPED